MSKIGSTLKSYLFWTYDRGSVPYDIMVTLILAFIFVSPHFVDFHDKPSYPSRRSNTIAIRPDGASSFICEVNAPELPAGSSMESRLLAAIEPVMGKITLQRYEAEHD